MIIVPGPAQAVPGKLQGRGVGLTTQMLVAGAADGDTHTARYISIFTQCATSICLRLVRYTMLRVVTKGGPFCTIHLSATAVIVATAPIPGLVLDTR